MIELRVLSLDGFQWPSGDGMDVAMLDIRPEIIEARFGVEFQRGADDLDYVRELAILLPSGHPVVLVWHERAPVPGLEVRCDVGVPAAVARQEVLAALEVRDDRVIWAPDDSGYWHRFTARP